MAQLYKMTLYVCDLEDSLSLDEIKTLIEQDALNGISVNCICHFADSKIGQNVEWDNDIDLNRCNCPTSAWEKYFAPLTKEKTNADSIRSMTDNELNELFHDIYNAGAEDAAAYEWGQRTNSFEWTMEWLKQSVEGE